MRRRRACLRFARCAGRRRSSERTSGEKVVRYQASGLVGSGDGIKAGVAYRMKDGSMVYVPEQPGAQAANPATVTR
ncbi:DUF2149 domain-containing protein [Cupriavidus necator]|uniref:DUF2149 domain-containing protein n=1 Tax=Cupriavidus necator TaxID=106590 RepID=A0A1U9UTV6_CUPNE|nr:DUF2149 domain-containing protein [Cupriavidus necator]